ncbi:MAG: F0F1 ATP synthase subunit A [Desulfuromonadaceae bacterium]|nr:F0F1 ATP synthase subunit A [Desulfuromonas sp.]MDY0185496.1 F0F1 ATP synthase subunit A [Desulfuromonadaceae bacterium]
MDLSSDSVIFWQYGWAKLNLTIVTTWGLMFVLAAGSWFITKSMYAGSAPDTSTPDKQRSRMQNALEIIVITIVEQLQVVGLHPARAYIGFIGTLFLFVALANFAAIFPGYQAPTGSLSTTAALAIAVFVAVPLNGIRTQGLKRYLASYVKPVWIMLPFNLIGEFSRTLALAVRLFGNMMSASMIGAILLIVSPLFFPLLLDILGLLTGMIQAYIFSILATVYIAAATSTSTKKHTENTP